MLHASQGANLDFHAARHTVHASSPVRAERELHLCLHTGELLWASDGGTEEERAYQEGLRVERVHVRRRRAPAPLWLCTCVHRPGPQHAHAVAVCASV